MYEISSTWLKLARMRKYPQKRQRLQENLIKEEIRALIRRKIIFNQQMKMMS